MNQDLFSGERVRLVAPDMKQVSKLFTEWGRDSVYWRLGAAMPAALFSDRVNENFFGGWTNPESRVFLFMIEHIEQRRILGDVEIFTDRLHRTGGIGIAIGRREDWGQGYGTEAMRLILRYGFHELNLYKIGLSVYSYNTRAIRTYEKVGFQHEGSLRQSVRRAGEWYDTVYMGILREAWHA